MHRRRHRGTDHSCESGFGPPPPRTPCLFIALGATFFPGAVVGRERAPSVPCISKPRLLNMGFLCGHACARGDMIYMPAHMLMQDTRHGGAGHHTLGSKEGDSKTGYLPRLATQLAGRSCALPRALPPRLAATPQGAIHMQVQEPMRAAHSDA